MEREGPTAPGTGYRVRRSARAKYARLRLSPHDGLTVVVPAHFDLALVPRLVEQQRAWLERAQARLGVARPVDGHGPPLLVELSAIGETWAVSYEPGRGTGARTTVAEGPGGRLSVRGAHADPDARTTALRRWLDRRARAELGPWLLELAAERGLEVNRVAIRGQRTRWGSCSADGTISLNRSLLFLPAPLVRHVLLHELCHRRHMDHSPAFWHLLAHEDPHSTEMRRELRTAWRHVPAWVRP